MKNNIRCEWTVVTCFLLASAWFFFPIGKPEGGSMLFAMRLALPAVVLAVGSFWLRPKLMMMAFWFCALGDAMGVLGSFEGQMAGFALAHICFISFFLRKIHRAKERSLLNIAIVSLICLGPLGLAAWKVIPAITDLPIQIGCSVYALLLTGTLWTAAVREYAASADWIGTPFKAVYGAAFFLTSDFILSWNKFVEHIPHASFYIMITYYCALLLLFTGVAGKEKR